MIVGEVIGNVWATRKEDQLRGLTFLVIEAESGTKAAQGERIVAVDRIGAGTGDKVLITRGSAASRITGEALPIDAAVIGIIDSVETERGATHD